jgi:signal transduction histidine kinase
MFVPLPWFAVAISTTLINAVTLAFVARREQNRALRIWAWAWGAWALAAVPLVVMGASTDHPLVSVACGALWVVSALLFVAGCYRLVDRSPPRAWLVVAAVAVCLALFLGLGPHGKTGMIPLVAFQCVGLVAAGVLVIRHERRRLGAWLSGSALVLLGLHVLDAPFFISHAELMPWGFVIATGLQVVAALGMLALHYERAREAQLASELAFERSLRLRSLGRAAGSVAHDFNNILTIMQGQLDLLREAGDDAGRTKALASLDSALAQAHRFTSLLLSVGREAELHPELIDVRLVVSTQLDLLKESIPPRIALHVRALDGPMMARLDRALIEQIVMNLVTNARDAIRGEGQIEVEIGQSNVPNPCLSLLVKDSGVGMDAELQRRVFEPFFTTKPEGKGTGLGLASVQGAVSQLGGSVHVQSKPGNGSCFEVRLPF